MSILSATVESKFIGVDTAEGLKLLVILNGPDGPVAVQLIDRTQKAQPRTIEFTQEQWQELWVKIRAAYADTPAHTPEQQGESDLDRLVPTLQAHEPDDAIQKRS